MNDAKIVVVIVSSVIIGVMTVAAVIALYARSVDLIDASAPVVESCIKHPATRDPFRGFR